MQCIILFTIVVDLHMYIYISWKSYSKCVLIMAYFGMRKLTRATMDTMDVTQVEPYSSALQLLIINKINTDAFVMNIRKDARRRSSK